MSTTISNNQLSLTRIAGNGTGVGLKGVNLNNASKEQH